MRDDHQLIVDYLQGDAAALLSLFDRHTSAIKRYAYSIVHSYDDVEDITQETFIKLWKYLKNYNGTARFKTWLFTIVKHAAIDVLRKKRHIAFSALPEDVPLEALHAGNQNADLGRTLRDVEHEISFEEMLTNVSGDSRTVLRLHYGDKMTFREIGEALEKPVDTVKSMHRRSLIFLREFL